jgi:hypothetical protein
MGLFRDVATGPVEVYVETNLGIRTDLVQVEAGRTVTVEFTIP